MSWWVVLVPYYVVEKLYYVVIMSWWVVCTMLSSIAPYFFHLIVLAMHLLSRMNVMLDFIWIDSVDHDVLCALYIVLSRNDVERIGKAKNTRWKILACRVFVGNSFAVGIRTEVSGDFTNNVKKNIIQHNIWKSGRWLRFLSFNFRAGRKHVSNTTEHAQWT